jgi:dTMP kinase
LKPRPSSGLFITFEGVDGSGKSTQAALFCERLARAGGALLTLRDPGATAISERIRAILLDRGSSEMSPWTELLLYEAARAQMTEELILPALAAGRIVVCDRYYDSTTAYQGFGRQMDLALVHQANRIGSCGLVPDATFLIDTALDVVNLRLSSRAGDADRMEAAGDEFHERVRQGYLQLAGQEQERIHVIPGNRPIESIQSHIWQLFISRFQRHMQGPGEESV